MVILSRATREVYPPDRGGAGAYQPPCETRLEPCLYTEVESSSLRNNELGLEPLMRL